MNAIEKIRKEIQDYFSPANLVENSGLVYQSPSKSYRIESKAYKQTKENCNWNVAQVDLIKSSNNELLRQFYVNDSRYPHEWIEKDGKEYLFCPEDLYGGQTLVDLELNQMASYSPGEDGFISMEFYLSPNACKLAIVGCVWSCPYELRIYDFANPMHLPWREIATINIDEYDDQTILWVDNETISIKDCAGKKAIFEVSDISERSNEKIK